MQVIANVYVGHISYGKEYEVINTESIFHTIIDDSGDISQYPITFFDRKEVKQMSNVSYHITLNNLVVAFNGKVFNLNKADVRYNTVLQAIKADKLDSIPDLLDVSKSYAKNGLLLKDNMLWLDNEPLGNALSDRILVFQKEGIPFDNLIKFARKLRANPSYNSRDQLYKFLEHNGHPITSEGNFIAYRGVTEDFKDVHTRTFNNTPGSVCEMPRQAVDDNPNNTCSRGLHVACYEYASTFGPKLVEVEVDPRDVVCVPTDYNGTKMRTCKFKVVNLCEKINENVVVDSSYEESDEFSGHVDEVDEWEEIAEVISESSSDFEEDDTEEWEQLQLRPSDVVERAEYLSDTKTLKVYLKDGGIYEYTNVPTTVTYDWEDYHSTGAYYVSYIAHSYSYTKLS